MAAAKEDVSFDSIIQAGRQKRKNEELASKLLGKNRRTSAPGSGVGKKAQGATPGSLASRIGVAKRSASVNSRSRNNSPLPPVSSRNRGSVLKPANSRRNDDNRLAAALNDTSGQATVRNTSVGMSIKGTSSGSFTVVGSNFAPGTTAADIQSAVEPMSGQILSCYVVSQRPTVTAELVFAEKWSAENAIANFHNQRADGRVLSMRLKSATATSRPNDDVFNPPTAPRGWSQTQHSQSFSDLREQADQQRRLHRQADPAVQDASYGFSEQDNQLLGRDERGNNYRSNNRRANGRPNAHGDRRGGRQEAQQSRLYSDEMMVDAPQPSRSRGRRQ